MKTLRWISCLFLALLLAARPIYGAAPVTQSAVTRPSDADAERLLRLTRRAVELFKAGKLDDAEAALNEALSIHPQISINLYNMACIKARKNRPDAAMDYLERAATCGFTNFNHIENDPDLLPLRQLPRFKRLIGRKEEYLRHAAQRELQWLRSNLDEGYLYELDEENRLIFATNTDAQTLAALKKSLLMQARSQWREIFSHRPDQYISIVLPSAADFRKLVAQPGAGGVYNHENHILIAQRLGQVMQHEFTHALHNADLDAVGQEHATWVSEGLGAMFEAAWFDGDRLVPADNYRLHLIQIAGRKRHLIPLKRLFEQDGKEFARNPINTYGQSGSLLLFLYEQNLLRRFYDTYKATYDKDKTGRLALEQVTGKPLPEIEAEWFDWMMQRTPPPLDTGDRGAILGVRIEQVNDGLRVDYLVPTGPAARGGVQVGDVIVAVDSTDVRDQQSLIPLLAGYQPGQTISIRVRRNGRYLDVPVTLAARSRD